MALSLGIDAAWTTKNASGVALVEGDGDACRLLAAAESYVGFVHLGGGGAVADTAGVLDAARRLGGAEPDILAVDMPLAKRPITARRAADAAISRAFGERGCSTHSPNPSRPGAVSEALRVDFGSYGYRLCVTEVEPRALIEVYPHPALVVLAGAERRLPYKGQNIRKYWPDAAPEARWGLLGETWRSIVGFLDGEIEGVGRALPIPGPKVRGAKLKAWEDKLDAVVCAWVGMRAMRGEAQAFGDAETAIWVPRPAQSGASM